MGILDKVEKNAGWPAFDAVQRSVARGLRKAIDVYRDGLLDGVALILSANGEGERAANENERKMDEAAEAALVLYDRVINKPYDLLLKIRAIHFLLNEGDIKAARTATLSALWQLDGFSSEPAERAGYDFPADYYKTH